MPSRPQLNGRTSVLSFTWPARSAHAIGPGARRNTFLGASRTLAHLARPSERAGLFAAGYVINHLASGLPVIAAGLAASFQLIRRAMTL
ncbi:hypothetical protein [Streptomyces sp. 769]|uniref:hypothetical protein n=1 Tax=Streptomyces sp. 769 TaxID=1262452 RepID=UPI0005807851|nr:hypothetical protein [Streptomyces sp. 769]